MYVYVVEWMDGWMGECMHVCIYLCVDEWMDGFMNGCVDE